MTDPDLNLGLDLDLTGLEPSVGDGLTSEQQSEYSRRLAEKLKDPEFRKTEGFPNGTDEAILALSAPMYYTACPNPFLEEWIAENNTPYEPDKDDYHREPYAWAHIAKFVLKLALGTVTTTRYPKVWQRRELPSWERPGMRGRRLCACWPGIRAPMSQPSHQAVTPENLCPPTAHGLTQT
jgi:hypothetical protein